MDTKKRTLISHTAVLLGVVLTSNTFGGFYDRVKTHFELGQWRKRIANGSGNTVQELNRLVKMYDQIKDMTKKMRGSKGRGLQQMMGRFKG